ncbi:MAG: sulfate adenylyltransferase, partial [Cyanobacteriota bacterium]|nr:sulfate adenylyltransferase [Cyanobacteriota bacterium]
MSIAPAGLIQPHGGTLVDLLVPAEQRDAVRAGIDRVVECSDRNACDVELLVVGGFSPLRGFMHQADYESVVASHRTSSGLLFGLPIVFDTADASIAVGERLLLTYRGQELAVLTVESRWEPDKVLEAKGCYGTTSLEHPAVRMIATERGRFYIGGRVQGLELPRRVFPCRTPAEVRATLPAGQDVVAFQCRNPIHRAHYELFTRALEATNVSDGAVVLVHPTCGPTQHDDIPGEVRFQTYERLAAEVANPRIRWAELGLADVGTTEPDPALFGYTLEH